jgi:ubiquinone/menaquinone biosynthesis C-methylase UbiE
MHIEAMAQQAYDKFTDIFQKAPEDKKPSLVKEAKTLLYENPGTPDEITQATFERAFRQMEPYIQAPELLFGKAKEAITELLRGRPDHLTANEISLLAAYLCEADIYRLRDLPTDPEIYWSSAYEDPVFLLPNPWYLHLPKYPMPVAKWTRKKNEYIQPRDYSLEERIAHLQRMGEPVTILDAGTGSGAYLQVLKEQFGDAIHTVGLGLCNQTLPVDENVITPMEILPIEWTNRFDIVISNFSLCYSLYPVTAIKELLRVLKPNREAYLDISDHLNIPFSDIVAVGTELLEPDIPYNYSVFDSFYADLCSNTLDSYPTIKALIENLSDTYYTYTVERARRGDGRGYPIQITKHQNT